MVLINDWEFCELANCDRERLDSLRDRFFARQQLLRLATGSLQMSALRSLLSRYNCGPVHRMTGEETADRVAGMLVSGRLHVHVRRARGRQTGSVIEDEPAPVAAQSSQPRSDRTYIEILVVDEDGKPVANEKYRLALTDGSVREGKLPADGRIFVPSLPRGNCDMMLFQMLDLGVPNPEVKRSWDWKSSQGRANELSAKNFDTSGSEPLIADS